MPPLYNDPEHWRKRADEARDIAWKMTDSKGKSAMLEIADKYDQLAKRAIRRMAAETRPIAGARLALKPEVSE